MAVERFAYYFMILFTVGVIFFGVSYLPMNDLPQYAAQVVALDDFLKGKSDWPFLELNPFTPYLVGYAIWLPLYQFLEIDMVARLTVSLNFILFTYAFRQIREYYQGQSIVDWVVIPSFFGFAYYWGFITFLLGIVVGLFFYLRMLRWFDSANTKEGYFVCIWGLFLFFSHVLSFLFFVLLSGVVLLYRHHFNFYKFFAPFIFFGFLIVGYLLKKDSLDGFYTYGENWWRALPLKVEDLLVESWALKMYDYGMYQALSLLLILLPFIAGYRLTSNLERYIPLTVFLLCWFCLPYLFNNVLYIYNRYTLLFWGFYYLVFDRHNGVSRGVLFRCCIYIVLLALIARVWFAAVVFDREAASFDRLLNKLPERKLAVSLIFNAHSVSLESNHSFWHFVLWYQAKKHGWVDFNFAWTAPQLLRFKADSLPEITPEKRYFVKMKNCEYYDLVIIRSREHGAVERFLNNWTCTYNYKPSAREGEWLAFEVINK